MVTIEGLDHANETECYVSRRTSVLAKGFGEQLNLTL
jgi:hypothetical protein